VAFIIKVRVQLLRDIGAAVSPFNSFLFIQGLETLPLRQRQHSENALEVARFLKSHPRVAWVTYPGLPDDPNYRLAAKYLSRGFGGLVGFGIKGGREAGKKFIESVQLLSHLANIGDAKSSSFIRHPTDAPAAHARRTGATGVTRNYIRLSVRIEEFRDIIGRTSIRVPAPRLPLTARHWILRVCSSGRAGASRWFGLWCHLDMGFGPRANASFLY